MNGRFPEDAYRRKVVSFDVPSACLGRPVTVRVFLPPGDAETEAHRALPAVYAQDGQHVFQYGRAATLAHALIAEGVLRPFRLVGIEVNLATRLDEYHPEGRRNAAYRCFFFEELLPAAEARYPVPPSGLRRIAAGDSLGGTVSFDLALDRPDLFQGVISLSTAFVPALLRRLQAAKPEAIRHLRVFQYVGTEETAVQTRLGTLDILAMNREGRRLLEANGVDVRYVERPGAHTWGAWQKILPESLRHFFGS
ncbi:MAG: esterase family protein [Hydrogenibacillus schlegelii]|nr:esterase family protein [Hydrogenibacillus schlegelii]